MGDLLASVAYDGPAGAPPLLIAHGLFGSARNWSSLAKQLARRRPVITVDMRNHGDSFRADSQSYDDMAADLARVIEARPERRIDVLGHSMGGKAAMALALTAPRHVNRLIVGDIAPVAYGHSQKDLVEAMASLDLDTIETRRDADTALANRVADRGVRAFLLQSLDVRGGGWALNLEVLGAEMESIVGWPDIPGRFDGDALFLVGANSDYVTEIGEKNINNLFPNAKIQRIANAGHWLHAEQPAAVIAAVESFLDSAK